MVLEIGLALTYLITIWQQQSVPVWRIGMG